MRKRYINKMKFFREKLDVLTSQEKLAKDAGLTLASYRKYEQGFVCPPVYAALRVAKALNRTAEEVFG